MPKGPKMELSDVNIDVTPDTTVDPFDWDTVQKKIQETVIPGLLWAPKFALVDFVYGLKKLIVTCQIINNMVPSTTVITEALLKIEGIDGAEMTSIETAAMDWRKEDAKAAKAAGGKKKKKKAKKEVVRVVDEKMIAQSAQKLIIKTKEAEFYVTGIEEVDGSGQTNVTKENFEAVLKILREKNPEVAVMLVTAGKNEVAVYVSVPASKAEKVSAIEWLKSTEVDGEGDANMAFGFKSQDPEKEEFPIKTKDAVSAQAFAYLSKVGAVEEESDDEIYGGEEVSY